MTMKSKQFHFESHDGKFYTALFSHSGAQRESNENAGLANTKEIEIL